MNQNNTNRKWYKKKRYVIPLAGLGSIILLAIFSDPSTTPTSQLQSENQNVEVETAPDQKVEIPAELNIENQEREPYQTPYKTPYETPYLTPKKTTSECDPNYSGCVPIASDVDCAGGSGNGPAYVQGPVYVTGSDIYGLDRDGDGVACE